MADDMLRVKLQLKHGDTRRELEDIIHSVKGLQVQRPGDTHRADLLILELGKESEKEFEFIHSLLNMDAVGDVFLISRSSDPAVLLQAIRAGAKEFFAPPISKHEMTQALKKFMARREKTKDKEPVRLGQIIHVLGSKGGVGTTTVAVNLAVGLAEEKRPQSVVLVDLNLLFGEIPLFLDIKPDFDWGEIAKNISRLDATFLMNILSRHTSGLYILPSPGYLNGTGVATSETMARLLNFMQTLFDFVVIDGGQSLDETALTVIKMSNTVLLITTLSLPCLSNTHRLLKTFYDLGYRSHESIKVVINRYLRKSEISLKDAEDGIDKKIFWTIPNDYRTTISAINQGKALSQIASRASITKNLRELADALVYIQER